MRVPSFAIVIVVFIAVTCVVAGSVNAAEIRTVGLVVAPGDAAAPASPSSSLPAPFVLASAAFGLVGMAGVVRRVLTPSS